MCFRQFASSISEDSSSPVFFFFCFFAIFNCFSKYVCIQLVFFLFLDFVKEISP